MNVPADYPHLLSSIEIAGKRLRNRVVFASVYTGFARNGEVTDELIAFHANRARGGVAMIVTEPLAMWRGQTEVALVRVGGNQSRAQLQRWAEAVLRHDCHLVGQVQDAGRGDVRPMRKLSAVAPSSLPDDLSWTMPRSLTGGEISGMLDDFAGSSVVLRDSGFSGVEISGGHGHIFHQFMSPWMNHREDEYGGSFDNRMRFLDETIAAIRSACGDDFIIGVRLPGNDGLSGSIDWAVAAEMARWLTRSRKVDYLTFVQGSQAWTLHLHVPDLHCPRGPYVEEIARLRDACGGVPVAALGRILEPAQAEGILAGGKADLILLGRALIADAAWVNKAAQGRDGDIRKCVSGNNCWGETVKGRPLGCDSNPRVGMPFEDDWRPERTTRPKRVVVVGGGVAGLEVAWVAAARGHEVTLFSASAEPGGKLRRYARLPGCESMSSIPDVQVVYGSRSGVTYRTSWQASAEDVLALQPDTIVIATGGTMMWPTQLPTRLRAEGLIPDLWSAIDSLARLGRGQTGTAIVYDFDGTDVTYSTAECLGSIFERVVIVNPCETVARDEPLVKRQAIYRRMFESGIELVHWSEPAPGCDFERGLFICRNVMTGAENTVEDVVYFTYATPRVPNLELHATLQREHADVRVVGDARMPRSTIAVMREAHECGASI